MKDRIKQIRKSNKLTQEEFARTLNVSKSTIESIEYGRREATKRFVLDICRIYCVNETWLVTGEGEMLEPETKERKVAEIADYLLEHPNDTKAAFMKAIYTLSEEQLELLKEIAIKMYESVADQTDEQ